MNFVTKILSNPGKRCGVGFLMILICGPLGAVLFPPLVVFVIVGALMFTALGESVKHTSFDSNESLQCELCNTQNDFKLIKSTHYMYSILPLWSLIKIPYRKSYYIYCPECARIHCEPDDISALLVLADGGMVNCKEITAEEFKSKLKNDI